MGKHKSGIFSSEQIDKAKKINETLGKVPDTITKLGVMYLGFDVFNNAYPGSGPYGTLFGLVSLELAKSMNLAAGAAGVSGLAALGLVKGLGPQIMEWISNTNQSLEDYIAGLPHLHPRPSVPGPGLYTGNIADPYSFWRGSVQYKDGKPFMYWDGKNWVEFE